MSTVIDLGALGTDGFQIQGGIPNAQAGWSVSTAGDVNGDGFDDIIVGAPFEQYGGSAYVLFGHSGGFGTIDLTNLDAATGFRIQGPDGNGYNGFSVSDAGDVNGDGFDDLIVGAASGYYNYSSVDTYVVYGHAGDFGTVDLGNLAASDGFIIEAAPNDKYSHTVSSAGDVNGDGYADIIIGADGDNGGSAYVVFGKADGFGVIDLGNLPATSGFEIHSGTSAGAGFSVASAGDVNGDGYADVIVGEPFGSLGGASSGEAYVVFGKAAGFGTIDLQTLSASDGFSILGAAGDTAGLSVSTAGDFNGDGISDLIIGAPASVSNGGSGAAYIIYGKTSGFGTIDLANLSSSAGIILDAGQTGDRLGRSVSSAGDVNGDGFDDVIIGAPYGKPAGDYSGEAYVIYGRAGGPGTIDLSALDPTSGFVIHGVAAFDLAGFSVSGGGDVNGDGYDDLVVGVPGADGGGDGAGAAYVIFGAATPIPHITGTDAGETLTGTNGNDYIDALGGNDILYGLAGDDRLYGGSGNDRLDGGAGIDRMIGGTGNDLYIVRDATDYAYENPGEGTDRVISSVDYRLRANVENLNLAGSADLRGSGNDLDNVITGNSGANVLSGLGGNDRLIGGSGDDRLYGGDGNDRLEGGAGHNVLIGGAGNDAYYVTSSTDYVAELAGEGTDSVYSTVSLALRANVEDLRLLGNAAINGYGNDSANVIAGNDAANVLKGGNGDDQLSGNGGDDHLYGGSGTDHVSGGAGDDWIEGGAGRDALYGGSGADSFVFRDGDFGGATPSTADHIYDFNQAEGDLIQLGAVDANSMISGNQAFSFIGTDSFSGHAGQLRYEQISGSTFVSGDTNGDGVADFMVRLDGLHALTSSDVVL